MIDSPAVLRCPWAIRFGINLNTRCFKPEDHDDRVHIGPGLVDFPGQQVQWYPGDRREYRTDRDEANSWED